MRENDLVKSVAKLVRRKIACRRSPGNWPPSPQEFIDSLESSKPLSCIFNAISWSINPLRTTNDSGYVAAPNHAQAEKISAIANSWDMLIGEKRPPLNTALSLTLHRISGSKESTVLLHHSGVGISYTDVRRLNNTWASSLTENKPLVPPGFTKGQSVHITFDNSDGRQQTLTGAHTTHHTTGTIFQHTLPMQTQTELSKYTNDTTHKSIAETQSDYRIPKKRSLPPTFPDFADSFKETEVLDDSFRRDVAFVLVGAEGGKCVEKYKPDSFAELSPAGSWTVFMKNTTGVVTIPIKLEYLPVIPLPPNDGVVKSYMERMLAIIDTLELQHIFVHADEARNSKILIISWMENARYDKIISLMGGFHTLMMFLKVLHKKYACLGFRNWLVDAGVIAEGSVDQALEGRHYFRGLRLHKQTFEALVRMQIKKDTMIGLMEGGLDVLLAELRVNPTAENLAPVLTSVEFRKICDQLTNTTGTESKMIVSYLKDVSTMLAMVSAVREHSIDRHMAAERAILPMCFAFGRTHYSRYLTFQHVRLEQMKMTKQPAWVELTKYGFGGSRSGEPFSAIHGDLITETTINREVKVRGGPMQGGYSTNNEAVNTFVRTTHVMAKIRSTIKDKLNVVTCSSHKESSPKAKKDHELMVNNLVGQLSSYFDPFEDGPARDITTGVEIDPAVVEGLLKSTSTGESLLGDFISKRLKDTGDERQSIFATISKPKIKTGLEKRKKDPKVIDILKEDRQAFGTLVGKAVSSEEAHSYPLTSIPLALATPEGDLRQSSKASMRNHMTEEANARELQPPAMPIGSLMEWLL